MRRLIALVPMYDPDAPEHLVHVYDLLEVLATRTALWAVCMSASAPPEIRGAVATSVIGGRTPLSRTLRLAHVLWRARRAGYRHLYVHYSNYGGLVGGLLMRLTAGRLFYWHCFVSTGSDDRLGLSSVWRAPDRVVTAVIGRLAHRLLTGTPAVARYYRHAYRLPAHHVAVVPSWINLARFSPPPVGSSLENGVMQILFLHRLNGRQGADLLPEIAARVTAAVSGVRFEIAGDGALRATVAAEAHRRGLDGTLELIGAVPNRQAPRHYADAQLFIMPARDAGVPRVLLEAMAMGVPFVATAAGGTVEIVPEVVRPYLTPPGDAGRFAEAVITFLRDEGLRRRAAEAGLAHVRQFSLERAADRLLEVIFEGKDRAAP